MIRRSLAIVILMKYTLNFFLFMAILLSGCTGSNSIPTPAASVTPEAKFTDEPPLPTSTAAATSPSPTLNPTQQVVSTLVHSTLIARSTEAVATDQAYNHLIAEFPDSCQSINSSLSPNGTWLATDCPLERDFRILNHDKYAKIYISYDVLFKDEALLNKTGYISPLFWSRDGLYFFFSKQVCCDYTESLSNSGQLYRFDLDTYEHQEVVSGDHNYFSFSPNKNIFIHIPDDVTGSGNPLTLNIINIKTLQKTSLPLTAFEQAGFIVWERSSNEIAMMVKTGSNADGNENFSVIIINLVNAVTQSIIANSKSPVVPLDWSSKNIITIRKDPCLEDQANNCMSEFLYYDTKLGEFTSQP